MSRSKKGPTQVTFPIVDGEGNIVTEERRKGDRRQYLNSHQPAYPIRDAEGDVIVHNRRRRVDRRVRRTRVVQDPNGPRLPKILLDTGEALYELNEEGASLTLGRSSECDIHVDVKVASRMHACIEMRDGGFVLIDDSRNGTALEPAGGTHVILHESETILTGHGVLRLGTKVEEDAEDLVRYWVIESL